MKTTNALVTYTDLSTMGLVAKGSPATGSRIATKSFINANYYVNQSASPYIDYSVLRCPPYQTIIAGPTNSGNLYYSSHPDGYIGFNTREEACAHIIGGSVTVYWSGTFGDGVYLYLDPEGITFFDGSNANYWSLGPYSFQLDVAGVYNVLACSVNSASIYYNYQSGPYVGWSNALDACDHLSNLTTTVYWHGTLGNGTYIYSDIACTTIFNYSGDAYYYNIDGYSFNLIANISSYGIYVANYSICAPSTFSLSWGVGNQSGGNLKVLDNVGSILLNITSTSGTSQSGILTISSSQVPYTIRGSWVSGSGNTIKYRVCDITSEIFYSGPIIIGESVDYTPSPTPLDASVYLTAQNIDPPICPA